MSRPTPVPSSRSARVASNAGWLSLDAGLDVLAGVVSSVFVARVLGPERLGHYAYALTLVNLAGTVAAFGAPLATRKYMAEYLGRGEVASAIAVLKATLRFQASVALVVSVGGLAWVGLSERDFFLVPAMVSLVPGLLRGIATGALLATEDARWTVRASIVSTLIHLIAVLSVLGLNLGLVGLTSALLLGRSADFGIRWFYVRRHVLARGAPSVSGLPIEVSRRLVRFCWEATLLLALEIIVWNRFEILILEHFGPIENVAFFSIAFGAAQALTLVSSVAASAASITLMVQVGRAPTRVGALASEVAYFMALLAVPLAALAVGLAPAAVALVYGGRFAPASVVLMVLAAFTPFRAMFFAAQQFLVAKDDQRLLLSASVLGAAVVVLLAVVLIAPYGAVGAGLTKGLASAVVSVAVWYGIARRYDVRVPVRRIGRLAGVGALAAAATYAVSMKLPVIVALPAAFVVGVGLLAIGIRLVGAIDPHTRDRLLLFQGLLPRPLSQGYVFALMRLAAPTSGVR